MKKLWKKYQSQLLSDMLTVAIVSLLVKGVGFFKEILIADAYGVSELLDTFLIAFLVPKFIQSVFLNAYGSVFIPNYVQEKQVEKNTGTFQGSSFIITVLIALFMIGVTYIGIDTYLELLFPGHKAQYYELIKTQLWIILPCILFWGISSLISGLLMVENEFLYSSLNVIFVPIITIVLLLFFQSELQEKTLALGLLLGSIVSFLYLIVLGLKKKVLAFNKPDFKNKNIRILLTQVPAKMSSGLINGVNPMVDQYFSAQIAIGAIAALNYGHKIPMVVIGLAGAPIGNTLLPYFSKKAMEGHHKLYEYLKRVLRTALGLMGIITVVLIFLSKLIVQILFERGAFTSEDTTQVYVIQQMYLIQLPFYIVGIIMNKYLTAINKNNFLVLSSLISLALNISLNYIFMELMGTKGLALATSLVSLGNSIAIYLYIKKLHK
ncbi:virulence factor MviN [Muricauda sp. TY007]|uniref:murein biosynthesis integral membrane protein MurJ n=1 Tax=Allomuricauda sp. TY007 TaxID=2683200 RepID=UPI0013C2845B|nr:MULTISPECIES: lipid II flippase MurJ [unclassified Allomuricauda]MBA4744726.1 polysaccharide biosynthesis C-terminal domain-containing protein [Allomuricauda sp.]NDV17311.1 virulence factor MviN [Muricauda sp. TY007]